MTEPVILAPNLQINQNLIPYDDLDIQGDFGRKQRYPHDVLPTITALEAIDTNKQPRMLKSTPDGHLIVHPDLSSGGGGVSPIAIVPYDFSQSTGGGQDQDLGTMGPIGSTIYGVIFSYTYDAGSLRSPNQNGYVRIKIWTNSGSLSNLHLATIALSVPASGTTDRIAGEVNHWFYPGIQYHNAKDQGDGLYHIKLDEVNIGGGNISLNIWSDQ